MPKGRDSGMPPLAQWESNFDATAVLAALRAGARGGEVVEFGCGYGSFTIPAAQTADRVQALDIDPEMVRATAERAKAAGLNNVVTSLRDFLSDGSGLPDGTAQFAMLFNILHIEEPIALLREARRVLAAEGTLGVIHWRSDRETPHGPPLAIRPSIEQCRAWAGAVGFRAARAVALPGSPWHWGLVLSVA